MILDRVTVFQFRCYAGANEFNLTPRKKYGRERPIVLFGGLNGAGKTTLLLAVKLALYGRRALGSSTSKSEYERHIRSCIHREPDLLIKPNHTYVELDLTYGKLGERFELSVRREWLDERKGVKESLSLVQNGKSLDSLSDEECQAFLHELLPPGVSDLFFFDGEKIAQLAEDDSGEALGDAIRRLLGLDLVDRLRSDLRVFQLRTAAKTGVIESSNLDDLQVEHEEANKQLAADRLGLEESMDELKALELEKEKMEGELLERGGEWGVSRQEKQQKAVKLAEDVSHEERELRELLNGVYPLTLARDVLTGLVEELTGTVEAQANVRSNEVLSAFAEDIKSKLAGSIAKKETSIIDDALASAMKPIVEQQPLVDLTPKELGSVEQTLEGESREAAKRVQGMGAHIRDLNDELDRITLQIERAPDESLLADKLASLGEINERIVAARADVTVRRRELEDAYGMAIDRARNLKRKHETSSELTGLNKPMEYASKTRALLKEFSTHNAQAKVGELEREFAASFRRLSRKDNLFAKAVIDPKRFTVALLDDQGETVERAELSAGERQIYAIAMLEALSRTSGRKLPILVDTPLGRLDSEHRESLVENYFPQASHQVIVLSTDTEVGQDFYESLSPSVSHAFEVRFDEETKATEVFEGYFWRDQLAEAV